VSYDIKIFLFFFNFLKITCSASDFHPDYEFLEDRYYLINLGAASVSCPSIETRQGDWAKTPSVVLTIVSFSFEN
jgi:hypothetical protein